MLADILLTNDDGVLSTGLRSLLSALRERANVVVVAPEQPRSAAGLSITVHKPLRISRVLVDGFRAYTVSGTTGDCVMLALSQILSSPPRLVCSGINIGENLSLSEFFMSGTVAGAIAGAINGVPSIAFSKREPEQDVVFVAGMVREYDDVAAIAADLAMAVMEQGLPKDVDLLNVNFPEMIRPGIEFEITQLAAKSFEPEAFEKTDPRGRSYVWLWGEKYSKFPRGTDAHATIQSGRVSITPICLRGLAQKISKTRPLLKAMLDGVSAMHHRREERPAEHS